MNAPAASAGFTTVLSYVKPYRGKVLLAMVALLVSSSAVLSMGWALRHLVDEGLSRHNQALLNGAFLALMGVIGLLALAAYTRYCLFTWIGERVTADMRRDLYARLLSMDVGYFESTSTGDLLSRITTDTTLLQSVIGSAVSITMRNALVLIGGMVMLLLTSPTLTAYVMLMIPVVVAPIVLFGRKLRILSRQAQTALAQLNAHAEESINGIRTVQAMSLEEYEYNRYMGRITSSLSAAHRRIRMRALVTALVIGLVFGAVATVMWIGGSAVLQGTITAGDLSAFVFYSVLVASAVAAISEVMADLQRAAGAADHIAELLDLRPVVSSPADAPPMPPCDTAPHIAFESVTFRYPARPDHAALHELSLKLEPGTRVALVGPSGAGKTTLFQLLLRFYDPESGRILLNGQNIRLFDPKQVRRCIGLVPQEPMIFSASALENIRLGNPDATEPEVITAARSAHAYEFLEKLPQGIHTHLGEKGIQLSGGQRQRIAIARALVRNPSILLLDEATSALDAESEQLVQDALSTLTRGRTTLIIAHRLSTVRHADRIVLLNQGKIEAIGTHDSLLADSPLYAKLARLQFQHTG